MGESVDACRRERCDKRESRGKGRRDNGEDVYEHEITADVMT
jgi:hypothetical protein